MPDAPPPWWRRKLVRAEVKTPLGSIGVDTEAASADDARTRRLYEAIWHAELHSRWYEEPGLETGEWIFFEAQLAYQTIDIDKVFRYSHPGRRERIRSERQSDDGQVAVIFASTDGPVNLLLHGSAEHLVELRSSMNTGRLVHSPSSATWLLGFLEALAGREKVLGLEGISDAADLASQSPSRFDLQYFASNAVSTGAFRRISAYMGPARSIAAKMRGYARVTIPPAGDPQTVVATPLFVEYARKV